MKEKKRIIRNIGIAAGIVLIVGAGIFAAYNRLDLLFNPPATELPEHNSILLNMNEGYDIPVASLKFSDGKVIAIIKACFDMGSAINTMSEKSYKMIKERGYIVKEYFCPLLLTDANKRTRLHTKCVQVDLPVMLVPKIGLEHCIRGVRFFVTPGEEMMSFGTEFLKEFVVHIEDNGRQWRLDKKPPESYAESFHLKSFNWHVHDLGGRYYWNLSVGGTEEDFFIDTAYGFSSLQMPVEDYDGNNVAKADSLYAAHSVQTVKNIYDTLNVRAGGFEFDSQVCFAQGTRNTYYVVNPQYFGRIFNLSIDLGNKMIYIVK